MCQTWEGHRKIRHLAGPRGGIEMLTGQITRSKKIPVLWDLATRLARTRVRKESRPRASISSANDHRRATGKSIKIAASSHLLTDDLLESALRHPGMLLLGGVRVRICAASRDCRR